LPSSKPTTAPTTGPTYTPGAPTLAPSAIPTFVPSFKPSSVPTLDPTVQAYPILSFDINTKISGVYTCNLTIADKKAIVNTTAESMSVKASYVSFLSCNVSSATSRRILLANTGIIVRLSTVIPLNNAQDSSNATGFYNKLIVKLTAAVNSGNFTKLLQQVSTELGATSMKNATISTITSTLVNIQYPPTSNPTKQPSSTSSSSSKKLSGGAIAGIVIGSILVFILFIVLIYFVFIAKTSNNKIATTYQEDEPHNRAVQLVQGSSATV
jgi:hypothetical protein